MSRQIGGMGNGGNAVARGAGFAAAKGAGLIALAVVIGIVLLNVVDDGSVDTTTKPPADSTPDASETTPDSSVGSTTPTSDAVEPKTPQELKIVVLNGGAPAGFAKNMADALKLKGYTNITFGDWTDHEQTGNSVLCNPGLDAEGSALAVAVGPETPKEPMPDPPPPNTEGADCVVVVGAPPA